MKDLLLDNSTPTSQNQIKTTLEYNVLNKINSLIRKEYPSFSGIGDGEIDINPEDEILGVTYQQFKSRLIAILSYKDIVSTNELSSINDDVSIGYESIKELYFYVDNGSVFNIKDDSTIRFPYSRSAAYIEYFTKVLNRKVLYITYADMFNAYNNHYYDAFMPIDCTTGKPLYVNGTNYIIKSAKDIYGFILGKKIQVAYIDHPCEAGMQIFLDEQSLDPLSYNNELITDIRSYKNGIYHIFTISNSQEGFHVYENDIIIGINSSTYNNHESYKSHDPYLYSKEKLGERFFTFQQFLNEFVQEIDFWKYPILNYLYTSYVFSDLKENILIILESDSTYTYFKEIINQLDKNRKIELFVKYRQYLGKNGRETFISDTKAFFRITD